MQLDQIKKGLFGYKKTSVYEYISYIENEFATKMAEKVSENQRAEEQYRARIADLEAKLQSAQEQLEKHKAAQMTIASTMMEATRSAEAVRQEAQAKAKKEREEWEAELSAKYMELEQYSGKIKALHDVFEEMVSGMNRQVQDFARQVETVEATGPRRNMGLFERKDEAEE